MSLNHPFFIYPNGLLSEYNNYSLYCSEVIRLYKFIEDLNIELKSINKNFKSLISFIIGSTMEDALIQKNTDYKNIFQFQQLFPTYINDFIFKYSQINKLIQIIIVSPDKFFTNGIIPQFINFTQYNFTQIDKYTYEFFDYELKIRVNIFNCPMPCVEKRENIILSCDNLLNILSENPYGILSFKQTQYDITFINNFYDKTISELFSVSSDNCKIIINSWVNFKNLYGYSENYNMFPKMLVIANKYNIIATEWNYIDELFYTKIISNYNFKNIRYQDKLLIYVNYDFNDINDNKILKINFNYLSNNKVCKINFDSEDSLTILN